MSIEHILNQDPHVRSSLIFGRGQFHAGVLIDPRPSFAIDPEDKAQLEEFQDKIWSDFFFFLPSFIPNIKSGPLFNA